MTTANPIEIYFSKYKMVFYFFIWILLFFSGILMIWQHLKTQTVFNSNTQMLIIASLTIVVALFGAYFVFKKILDKTPAIIIKDEGLIVNSGIFKNEIVPWSDVFEINEITIQVSLLSKQHFIAVNLIDPEKYLNKEKNSFKRTIQKANLKTFGSILSFNSTGLKINQKELLKLIQNQFQQYQKKQVAYKYLQDEYL